MRTFHTGGVFSVSFPKKLSPFLKGRFFYKKRTLKTSKDSLGQIALLTKQESFICNSSSKPRPASLEQTGLKLNIPAIFSLIKQNQFVEELTSFS
jgi:hypothetical protein